MRPDETPERLFADYYDWVGALLAAESERAALEESLSCRSDWHPDEIQKVVEECAKWERYAKQMDSERAELAREVETRESQIATIKTHFNARCEHLTERNGELAREVERLKREVSEHAAAVQHASDLEDEAEVYREHQAVEGWSLRAERAEARVAELEAALVNASDALPDRMRRGIRMPDKPHSELLAHVHASLDSYFEPDWEDVAEVYKSYASLVEQLETERKAWRKALDSALQYVPLKDHDFIEAIVSNPASRDSDA